MKLVALDTMDLSKRKDGLDSLCIMCRKTLNSENTSDEHIYPKWLLRKYNMYNEKLTMSNGVEMNYRKWIVRCCKECNGGRMSEIENIIKDAVNGGFDEFVKLDVKIIAWWMMKIYYSKIYKETMMKEDMYDRDSKKMIEKEMFDKYNFLFVYMSELYKGFSFIEPHIPYEIHIFKTLNEEEFDYIDDSQTNTVIMRLSDIIIVCSFNSFGLSRIQCERELLSLKKIDKVHFFQTLELFSKMVYYRRTYGLDSKHSINVTENGVEIFTKISNVKEMRPFDGSEMHDLIVNMFRIRDLNITTPYSEGNIISMIFGKNGSINTFEKIELILKESLNN